LDRDLAKQFGYLLYSARYGNIYTVHQLLQLAKESFGSFSPAELIWKKGSRFVDAMRPSVEPDGYETVEEALVHRANHLKKVKYLLMEADVLIFTLGLTEAWVHQDSGTVYPTAPGTIAGSYSPDIFAFKNYTFEEIYATFIEFDELIKSQRSSNQPPKIMLTVSPVPLTATASGKHVLQATSYSKAVLRAVAGSLESRFDYIDYFPSYEIVTNPASRSVYYESNLRSVRQDSVPIVMKHFLSQYVGKNFSSDHINKVEVTEISDARDKNPPAEPPFPLLPPPPVEPPPTTK
jgi:hypothetical protein